MQTFLNKNPNRKKIVKKKEKSATTTKKNRKMKPDYICESRGGLSVYKYLSSTRIIRWFLFWLVRSWLNASLHNVASRCRRVIAKITPLCFAFAVHYLHGTRSLLRLVHRDNPEMKKKKMKFTRTRKVRNRKNKIWIKNFGWRVGEKRLLRLRNTITHTHAIVIVRMKKVFP